MFKNPHICFILVLTICTCLLWSDLAAGVTPKQAYHSAEACYKKLRKVPSKMNFRDNWLRCIKKFQQVYRLDATGSWAPAGLYMSGKLYQELSQYSGSKSDLQEARDIYERIIKRYPNSRYQNKAALKLRELSKSNVAKQKPRPKTAVKSPAGRTDARYRKAESCYNRLTQNPARMKYRDKWMQCIDQYYASYQADPRGPRAAASLYMAGKLYSELHGYSNRKPDLQSAHSIYARIIDEFPDSRYRIKAELLIDAMPDWAKGPSTNPTDDIAAVIEANDRKSTGKNQVLASKTTSAINGMGTVNGLRFWSSEEYTRVVIDASRETTYRHHLLKKDPALNKPQRLYVDLDRSRLADSIRRKIPINDKLLIDARAGQFTPDSVRVVVDIKSFKKYNVFSLKDPFRIVIDVRGKSGSKKSRPKPPMATAQKSGKLPASALAKQLALGVSRIVIDPGHGGQDYGAPGYLKGVHEKDVVLQISRRLARKIREELKYSVYLTRNNDTFLTLEERTAIANTKNADLFISIHTNSHKDRRAYGIETYFLNLATDDDAIRVAAMENATSTKNISDLHTILSDLMQNAKINESSRLANYVQGSMVRHLKNKRYTRIKDKGVKQAPFYVLLGAQMPAVLVETSFISNPRECKRLTNPRYQERLCEAIVKGIRTYIRETSPTAFMRSRPAADING
jgi:N-acetylmuramoyl-L-alanine amidase